jgi:hypothetical protein
MKYIDLIKGLLLKSTRNLTCSGQAFELIRSGKDIIKELISNKASGNVVGVYAPALGSGMFLTGVQDLYEEGKATVVVFYRYDLSGEILSRNCITVDEIEMVCSFNQRYSNPLLGKCNRKASGEVSHGAIGRGNEKVSGNILRYY